MNERAEIIGGKNLIVEEGAVVGYIPARTMKDTTLHLGENAVVRACSIIYGGSTIGGGLETGHGTVIREENVIGDNLKIWNNSTIDYGCRVGNNVRIHCNVYIAQFTVIEDDVFFAPGVMITNDLHPICTACMKGPHIKKGAKIGANAVLLPGITIGENALVAAGAVVVEDVPAESVAAGNPAKIIKTIHQLECRTGYKEKPYGGIH